MSDPLEGRCGTCARFVRVVETIADTGEVKHAGDCLLGVWPSPLYETSTCSQWVRRGEFKAARGRCSVQGRRRLTVCAARAVAGEIRDRERSRRSRGGPGTPCPWRVQPRACTRA